MGGGLSGQATGSLGVYLVEHSYLTLCAGRKPLTGVLGESSIHW